MLNLNKNTHLEQRKYHKNTKMHKVKKVHKNEQSLDKNFAVKNHGNDVIKRSDFLVERRIDKSYKKSSTKHTLNRVGSASSSILTRTISKFGRTAIFVEGKSAIRAVSAISKTYRVDGVKVLNDGVEFFVDSKHCDKIIALLNNLCYYYKIVGIKGILPSTLKIGSRIGLALGVIAVVVALILYPQFVTNVSVVSVDGVSIDSALSDSVMQVLTDFGIRQGGVLSNINLKEIEDDILALDGISFASVERSGTHIKVSIKQELPSNFLDIDGSKVVSSKRAVVTRVVVESGTAVVKYGDIVDVGDVLIDGYVEYGDDKIAVEAKGYAYGKVYYQKSVYFADVVLKKVYGGAKTITKLSMFGIIPKTPKSPYDDYELKESVDEFGYLLPFKLYRCTFYQIEQVEEKNTLSEQEMYDIVYASILDGLPPSSSVINKYCKAQRSENGVYITVNVEVEERI